VPFHITITGAYTGAIPGVPPEHAGAQVTLPVSGIAEVRDGRVDAVRAVTSRAAVRYQLTGAAPI
jgi:predicted ester cyclase